MLKATHSALRNEGTPDGNQKWRRNGKQGEEQTCGGDGRERSLRNHEWPGRSKLWS